MRTCRHPAPRFLFVRPTCSVAPSDNGVKGTTTVSDELFSGGDIAAAVEASTDAGTGSPSVSSEAPVSTDAAPIAPSGVSAPEAPAPGPIPYERHKTILDGAYKERDDFKSRAERLAWAERYDPAVNDVLTLMQSDPVAFYQRLGEELAASPQYQQALRTHAARTLAAGRGAQTDADIEAALAAENGEGVYSAKQVQQLLQRQQQQIEQLLGERLKPVEEIRQERAIAQLQETAREQAAQMLSWASQQPGFTEHKAAIKAAMVADPGLTLERAYIQIVVPSLSQTERAKVVAGLHAKTQAGTTAPNTASTSTPGPAQPLDMRSAFRRAWAEKVQTT